LLSGVIVSAGLCPAPVGADVLHQFTTPNALLSPDDGYDPSVVTVVVHPDVMAPASGVELSAGAVGLSLTSDGATGRFWNTEWAGFTLSVANGTALDNQAEFDNGYLTWTVTADPGMKLSLNSLDFSSARGGGANVRGFEIYAKTNGAAFTFGGTPLIDVDDEPLTSVRTAPTPRSLDLSGLGTVDSITFRYYPLTTTVNNTIDFTGMTLNGTVGIPEPSMLAIAAVAGSLFLRRRRR
jgi:hypothetical protein